MTDIPAEIRRTIRGDCSELIQYGVWGRVRDVVDPEVRRGAWDQVMHDAWDAVDASGVENVQMSVKQNLGL